MQKKYFQLIMCIKILWMRDNLLAKFWTTEEPDKSHDPLTHDDQCEKLFKDSTFRDSTGRCVVSLPFKKDDPPKLLKNSKALAEKRFLALEKKLLSKPELRADYQDFMEEYESIGHMRLSTRPGICYIPHQAVVKSISNELKIRVVFDGSAKTPSGKALNDVLFVGPKLQTDICDILCRFRVPKFVFTADICKKYRQILIPEDHRSFQHILWRSSPDQSLKDYELCTIIYGLACWQSCSSKTTGHVTNTLEARTGYRGTPRTRWCRASCYPSDSIGCDKEALCQSCAPPYQLEICT